MSLYILNRKRAFMFPMLFLLTLHCIKKKCPTCFLSLFISLVKLSPCSVFVPKQQTVQNYKGNIMVRFSPTLFGTELVNESFQQFNSLLHKVYGEATAAKTNFQWPSYCSRIKGEAHQLVAKTQRIKTKNTESLTNNCLTPDTKLFYLSAPTPEIPNLSL